MDSNLNLCRKWTTTNWHVNVNKFSRTAMVQCLNCPLDPWNTACTNCYRWITFCSCIIACNNFNVFQVLASLSLKQFHNYKTIQGSLFSTKMKKMKKINNHSITVNEMFPTIKTTCSDCFFREKLQSVNGNLVGVHACIWITYTYD